LAARAGRIARVTGVVGTVVTGLVAADTNPESRLW